MSQAWKREETQAAALFNAKRFWANAGHRIDFEGPRFVGQSKYVARMSLSELTDLAQEVEEIGREKAKAGVVTVKLKRGRGKLTPRLVVVTESVWKELTRGGNGDT